MTEVGADRTEADIDASMEASALVAEEEAQQKVTDYDGTGDGLEFNR